MKRTIIGVWGTANIGKSMTLNRVGRQLEDAEAKPDINTNQPEYRGVFEYLGENVGVQTFGDTERQVMEGLDFFINRGCNIIAVASKGYGGTVNSIENFAEDNGYRLIWVAPDQIKDDTIQVEVIKERSARHIVNYINDIINGSL